MPRQAAPNRSLNNEFMHWYRSVPMCTRFLVTSTVLITFLGWSEIVWVDKLYMSWPLVWKEFQVWRIFTCFFYVGISITSVFNTFILYQQSKDLENTVFLGKTADYIWFLIVSMLTIVLFCAITPLVFISGGLLMSIVYLWSKHYPERIVSFMFGFQFKGKYLPYAWMLLEFIQGHGHVPYGSVFGAIAAHAYYYLKVEYPASGGIDYFPTPALIHSLVTYLQNSHRPASRVTRGSQRLGDSYRGTQASSSASADDSGSSRSLLGRRGGVRLGGS